MFHHQKHLIERHATNKRCLYQKHAHKNLLAITMKGMACNITLAKLT
uniref:Uncharacterized protein n=1 Tax=Rhizophora mucronata TaxID=61149 RepID=A0A2P2MQF7_RHIMU